MYSKLHSSSCCSLDGHYRLCRCISCFCFFATQWNNTRLRSGPYPQYFLIPPPTIAAATKEGNLVHPAYCIPTITITRQLHLPPLNVKLIEFTTNSPPITYTHRSTITSTSIKLLRTNSVLPLLTIASNNCLYISHCIHLCSNPGSFYPTPKGPCHN